MIVIITILIDRTRIELLSANAIGIYPPFAVAEKNVLGLGVGAIQISALWDGRLSVPADASTIIIYFMPAQFYHAGARIAG